MEKTLHLFLAGQIKLGVGSGEKVSIALFPQFPQNRGTRHTPVARDIDFIIEFHM
jgi:hypothetical protein